MDHKRVAVALVLAAIDDNPGEAVAVLAAVDDPDELRGIAAEAAAMAGWALFRAAGGDPAAAAAAAARWAAR
jgi:hypothetical protein